MTKEDVAFDIYYYLIKAYYGIDKEEVEYRCRYGTNGVIDKVLAYIKSKYLEKGDKNE